MQIRPQSAGSRDIRLQIGGISCAACVTRIEASLRRLPGVEKVRVDPATAEARLQLGVPATGIDAVLGELRRLGFTATVPGSDAAQRARVLERRGALKRLGVAGFGMMQTMMFAFALYASDDYRMDPAILGLLRYCSLFVALPVTVYAGAPIFRAALSQMRRAQPGMDVPVSLGIAGALCASVWHTFTGQGAVYFDAVTMFIFFLSASRFIEMGSRHAVGSVTEALAKMLPERALRITNGVTQPVRPGELNPGDEILVNAGDRVAADGTITSGGSAFDESFLTGESRPVARSCGAEVTGGSINVGTAVRVRVTSTGERTVLAAVLRLVEQSRHGKPRIVTMADRAARIFSALLLALAAIVLLAWLAVRPEQALASTIAVLVVTCPCALALAAPAVMASANTALARLGLLSVSADAVEQLAGVRHVVVDKTGTLTRGQPVISVAQTLRAGPDHNVLAIAAALERFSSHPLAAAFRSHEEPQWQATGVTESRGQGLEGTVRGRRYRIGQTPFVGELRADRMPTGYRDEAGIALGDETGLLARFTLSDPVRPDAREGIAELRRLGFSVEIASGDAPEVVAAVAAQLDIADWRARMSPTAKVERLTALQDSGRSVLMIGDGINDAPTLAAAHASIVMRSGSALAQTNADLLLLDGAWSAVPAAIGIARRARLILRQNLRWAVVYNIAATPMAALGWVPPWLAALGMSVSSLVVVLNAQRAGKLPRPRRPAPTGAGLPVGARRVTA